MYLNPTILGDLIVAREAENRRRYSRPVARPRRVSRLRAAWARREPLGRYRNQPAPVAPASP